MLSRDSEDIAHWILLLGSIIVGQQIFILLTDSYLVFPMRKWYMQRA